MAKPQRPETLGEAIAIIKAKARRDLPGFFRRFAHIETKAAGEPRTFPMNPAQMVVWRVIQDQLERYGRIRIVILKARQEGVSTAVIAYFVDVVVTGTGERTLVIGQALEETTELFGKVETMIDYLPDWLRPAKKQGTRGRRLEFHAPNKGVMAVETARKVNAGRSRTFHHVHATELPWWPDTLTTMTSLLQTVGDEPGTSFVVESTAQGSGDYFEAFWNDARNGRKFGKRPEDLDLTPGINGFVPIFIPWYWLPTYRRVPNWAIDKPFSMDEKQMRAEFDLDDQQVMWYRYKLRELKGDRNKMREEYPCTPEEAFVFSGQMRFNPEHVAWQVTHNVEAPAWQLEVIIVAGVPRFVEREEGDIWMWQAPLPGVEYTISADVASGRAEDFSTFHVWAPGRRQVCEFRGKLNTVEFGDLLWHVGRLYNEALIVCENTGIGEGVNQHLANVRDYANLYVHVDDAKFNTPQATAWGFATTPKSRPKVVEALEVAMFNAATGEEEGITIKSGRLVQELQSFIVVDPIAKRAEARPGAHDDLVLAACIGAATAPANTMDDDGVRDDLEPEDEFLVSPVTGY